MMRKFVLILFWVSATAFAQDAERGQRLFNQTSVLTGKPVANCTSCHADTQTLRAMLANRGVAVGDPKVILALLRASIAGAIPGARNAKAQYQNVLTDSDLGDLAAYLARVQSAALTRLPARH
jgi:cytochrome c553